MGEFVFEGDDGVRLRVWRHLRGASIQANSKTQFEPRARHAHTAHVMGSLVQSGPFYRDGAMGGMRDFAGRVARSEPCSEPAADGAAAAS